MFDPVLVANRGEIACRIMRTLRRMGKRSIAVFSQADRNSLHVTEADEAHFIGPSEAKLSYLNASRILEAATAAGAEAIHPGYGFLSENAEFAEACAKRGIVFVGPEPRAIRLMGLKDKAKEIAEKAGVSTIPGHAGADLAVDTLLPHARRIGYPLLIKAIAGGGGRGMRIVSADAEFSSAFDACRREAAAAFGDDRVLLEKYFPSARHVEVQVIGDSFGNVVHLYERDCSIQRRHQKIIEEAPAPFISDLIRSRMQEAAVAVARSVDYRNAGTVEFLYDEPSGRFYFMEMNTRLQVEHPVTEMITGVDLVEWQLRVAAGEKLPLAQDQIELRGHAVEARLYAEDPQREFLPQTGVLRKLVWPTGPAGCRIDAGVAEGSRIDSHYDPMIAKIIAWAPRRSEAIEVLARAVRETFLYGVNTNKGFLLGVLSNPELREKAPDTQFLNRGGAAAASPPQNLLALGCASWVFTEGAAGAGAPWSATSGWILTGGERQERHRVLMQGRNIDFAVIYGSPMRLIFGNERHTIELLASQPDQLRLSLDGELHEVHVHRSGSELFVDIRGHHLVVTEPSYLEPALESQGEGAVRAPMPGRVLKLETAEGTTVFAGERLLVLEAMKMEHILRAPVAGRLTKLAVAEGQQVGEGDLLCTIGPESS